MKNNLEELVKIYLTIRGEREKLLDEYETQDRKYKEDMVVIEQTMLTTCNESNADSIKTQAGTVMRKLNERFICSDWDNFRKFVAENDALELLERRIHQGNFKEFLHGHEQDGLPPE